MATGDEEDKDARFLPEIRRLQELGFSPYKVWRTLRPLGLSRSRDPFRKWCLELVNSQIIPPWPRDNRGRPRGRQVNSLGLLDELDQGNKKGLTAFGILVPLNSRIPNTLHWSLFDGHELDIPLAHDYEPDYSAYAKTLGWRRVQTFGDLDYYFLARWAREIRNLEAKNPKEASELNRRALQKAREIRSQMREAAKPTRRCRKKK